MGFRRNQTVKFIVFVLVCVGAAAAYKMMPRERREPWQEAYPSVQASVKKFLQSPWTAVFYAYPTWQDKGDGRMSMSGTVDCRGESGAPVRHSFSAEVQRNPSGSWVCTSVTVDNLKQF